MICFLHQLEIVNLNDYKFLEDELPLFSQHDLNIKRKQSSLEIRSIKFLIIYIRLIFVF